MKLYRIIFSGFLLGLYSGAAVMANPQGANVIQGQVQFAQPDANTLEITNSPNSIINWQSFSIQQNELTRFVQESASSNVLNRVVGENPSDILGQLQSNGRVFVINPNGIVFGKNAMIDTAGLIASTLDMKDEDFINGNLQFQGEEAGRIQNKGYIKVGADGDIFLIALNIENSGTIETDGGEVILAAGKRISIASLDSDHIVFDIQAPANEAINLGEMITNGGAAKMFATTIKNDGVIRANSITRDTEGNIVLSAKRNIANSGEIEAGNIDISVSAEEAALETIAFENHGQVSGTNLTIETSSKESSFGIANYGSLAATRSLDLRAWDNTLINPGKITTGTNGGISLLANDIVIEGEVSSVAGEINSFSQSFNHIGLIDVSSETEAGGDINIVVTHAYDAVDSSLLLADGVQGGSIVLDASESGRIFTSGTLSARGRSGQGGLVSATGYNVSLFGGSVDVSGQLTGGDIYWGGQRKGQGPLANAEQVMVTPGSKLIADGEQGGQIIVWSDANTRFYGGAQTGSDGFIEISSADWLYFDGEADAGGGEVLFDPKNLDLVAGTPAALQMIKLAHQTAGLNVTSGFFGDSVSLEGDILAVGVSGDDTGGSNRGAVFLFDGLNSSGFSSVSLKRKLTHGTAGLSLANSDEFGFSLSVNGDRLAVGSDSEQVFLFDGLTSPAFSAVDLRATITNGNFGLVVPGGVRFGRSVSLDGDRLAVGAMFETTGAFDEGAVYLFDGLNSANFAATQFRLKLIDGVSGLSLGAGNNFGSSVSLDGDRLAVGANGVSNFPANSSVHLFDGLNTSNFSGTTHRLQINNGVAGVTLADNESFGDAVAIDGDHLAVGAADDSSVLFNGGAVFLFDGLNSTNFTSLQFQRKLVDGLAGLNLPASADLGFALSLDGDRLAVSSGHTVNGQGNSGAVRLFDGINSAAFSGVTEQFTLTEIYSNLPITDNDQFGSAVSIDGDRLAIGSQEDIVISFKPVGSVYLFDGFNSSNFSNLTFKRKLTNGVAGLSLPFPGTFGSPHRFGLSVSLDGDHLAVGTEGNAGASGGAVYLFDGIQSTDFSSLAFQRKIGAGDAGLPGGLDFFGQSVSLDGDRLAVGEVGNDGNFGGFSRGAVHLFDGVNSAGFSSLTRRLTLDDNIVALGLANGDFFGSGVSLDDDRLAVGADGVNGTVAGPGAVFLFNGLNSANFASTTFRQKLVDNDIFGTDTAGNARFGGDVALDGDRLVVGAYEDVNSGSFRGSVLLYTGLNSTNFAGTSFQRKMKPGDPGISNTSNDQFGWSVALDGDNLAVGARVDDTGGTNRGAVYLFNGLNSSNFANAVVRDKLASLASGLELADGDQYGSALSVDGDHLAVGAPFDDFGATNRGAVYLFDGLSSDNFSSLVLQKKLMDGFNGLDLSGSQNFGTSVSLDADHLAVGAIGDDTGGTNRGAVFLFDGLSSDGFSAVFSQFKLADGSAGLVLNNSDEFGSSVSLESDRLAVGAAGVDSGGSDKGAVYLFDGLSSANFAGTTLQHTLSDGVSGLTIADGDNFGISLSLDADRLAVGASGDDSGGTDRGAVYLFDGLNSIGFSSATMQVKIADGFSGLTLSDNDFFGHSVALEGDVLAVGASQDDTGGTDRGAVYLFDGLNSTSFTTLNLQQKLDSSVLSFGLEDGDMFGSALAIDGLSLAVGAPGDDTAGSNRGATYFFSDPFSSALSSAAGVNFALDSGTNSTLSLNNILAIANTGTAVTLETNNDITLSSDLIFNNTGGDAGAITIRAGRSVILNANIFTDNGDLTIIANDTLVNGVVTANRDSGDAVIIMMTGTTLNAGTGNIVIDLRDGSGRSGAQAARGVVTLADVIANNLILQGGATVTGSGTINANVNNNDAILAPGASPGTLVINGNFVQAAAGVLEVELGGLNQGVNYDLLSVSGTATLDGTLNVLYFGGFTASAGDQFNIITSSDIIGDFATTNFPTGDSFLALADTPSIGGYQLAIASAPVVSTPVTPVVPVAPTPTPTTPVVPAMPAQPVIQAEQGTLSLPSDEVVVLSRYQREIIDSVIQSTSENENEEEDERRQLVCR